MRWLLILLIAVLGVVANAGSGQSQSEAGEDERWTRLVELWRLDTGRYVYVRAYAEDFHAAAEAAESWDGAVETYARSLGWPEGRAAVLAEIILEVEYVASTCPDWVRSYASPCEAEFSTDFGARLEAILPSLDNETFLTSLIDRLDYHGLERALLARAPQGSALEAALSTVTLDALSDRMAIALIERDLVDLVGWVSTLAPGGVRRNNCMTPAFAYIERVRRAEVSDPLERAARDWAWVLIRGEPCWSNEALWRAFSEVHASNDALLEALAHPRFPEVIGQYLAPDQEGAFFLDLEDLIRLAGRAALEGDPDLAQALLTLAKGRLRAHEAHLSAQDESSRFQARLADVFAGNIALVEEYLQPSLSSVEIFDALLTRPGWTAELGDRTPRGVRAALAARFGYEELAPDLRWRTDIPLGHPADNATDIELVRFFNERLRERAELQQAGYRFGTDRNYQNVFLHTPQAEADLTACPAYNAVATLPEGIPLDSGASVVTAGEREGDYIIVALSRAVDPAGEVSPGGYWAARTVNGIWQEPVYLGIQAYFPYEIPQAAPLFACADDLTLEANLREIDPASITFPPIALALKTDLRGLILSAPWAELEADRDGDGLTDILEERLGLDPLRPDFDADGMNDGRDPYPTISANAPGALPADVASFVLSSVFSSGGAPIMGGIHDDEEPFSIEDFLETIVAAPRPSTHATEFDFAIGNPDLFANAVTPERPLIMHDQDIHDALTERFGVHYPVEITVVERSDAKAWYVNWTASWVGGAFIVRRTDERLELEVISSWIT